MRCELIKYLDKVINYEYFHEDCFCENEAVAILSVAVGGPHPWYFFEGMYLSEYCQAFCEECLKREKVRNHSACKIIYLDLL